MDDNIVILPCETRAREFDAKLLLACHIAESGLPAVVGAKKVIDKMAPSLPRGIYIGKSMTVRSTTVLRMLRRLGFTVTAWDEEGLVWATPELYRLTKLDTQALQEPHCIFAWGEANAAAIRDHPGFTDAPVYLTGNPRTDLLRPALRGLFDGQANDLRARFGKFILINTNFSRINHFYPGESHLLNLLEAQKEQKTDRSDPKLGMAAHKKSIFEYFLKMVATVAEQFPEVTVVIRPHPSENHATWIEATHHCNNVQVIYEGNVVPWLMAAAVTVHNSCTTAVESFLLDRIALAYCPVTAEAYDHALPNDLSIQCEDLPALLDWINQALVDHASLDAQHIRQRMDLARHHLASYDGASSCERLVSIIHQLNNQPRHNRPSLLTRTIGLGTAYWRKTIKKRIEARIPGHRNNTTYLRHMFPLTSCAEVEHQIQRMGSQLGRFQNLRTKELAENVFMIQ